MNHLVLRLQYFILVHHNMFTPRTKLSIGLLLLGVLFPALTYSTDDFRQKTASALTNKQAESNASQSRLVHVSTSVIKSAENSTIERRYSGTVVAKRSSEVGFKRIGRLESLRVDQGDLVEEGQAICELETAEIEAQVAILQAQRATAVARLAELKAGPRKQSIEAAKAQLVELMAVREQVKSTFDRRNRLANSDAISTQDIDDARHQFAAADARVLGQREIISELEEGTRKEQITAQEAEVARLDASINALKIDIDESTLRAPFNGMIAKRFLDEGAIVQPGQAIFKVVEADVLEAFVGLPLDVAANIQNTETFLLVASDVQYTATLKALLPELDSGTRTKTAIFSIGKRKAESGEALINHLSPGQLIQLRHEQRVNQSGYWVPLSALTKSINGLWSIFVVDDDANPAGSVDRYSVHRVDVEVVQIDSARVLVRGDVHDGDRIVIDGVQKITPGQTISFSDVDF